MFNILSALFASKKQNESGFASIVIILVLFVIVILVVLPAMMIDPSGINPGCWIFPDTPACG